VTVDYITQPEQLAPVAEWFDQPEANESREQMNAVVADIDRGADRDVGIAAGQRRVALGRA
jgi:hypothetical protein